MANKPFSAHLECFGLAAPYGPRHTAALTTLECLGHREEALLRHRGERHARVHPVELVTILVRRVQNPDQWLDALLTWCGGKQDVKSVLRCT